MPAPVRMIIILIGNRNTQLCFLSFVSCTNSHLSSLCLNECHCFVSNRSPSHSFFLLYKVPKVKQHGHYVLTVSFMCRKNEPFTSIRDGYTHRNSHTMVLCLTNGFSKPNLKAESDVITDIRVQIDLTYTLSFYHLWLKIHHGNTAL